MTIEQKYNYLLEAKKKVGYDIGTCDFCGARTDIMVDGKTKMGVWAIMCTAHYLRYGVCLGLGSGQAYTITPEQ